MNNNYPPGVSESDIDAQFGDSDNLETNKPQEVVIEEAIHRNKARIEKRKKLCLIDDCQLEDTQVYSTDFKGTHPIGIDVNRKKRQQWLKEMQGTDFHSKFCITLIQLAVVYVGVHLIVAILTIIFKQ